MNGPVKGQAAGPGLEQRLAQIEKRLTALEAARERDAGAGRRLETRRAQTEKRA